MPDTLDHTPDPDGWHAATQHDSVALALARIAENCTSCNIRYTIEIVPITSMDRALARSQRDPAGRSDAACERDERERIAQRQHEADAVLRARKLMEAAHKIADKNPYDGPIPDLG